MLIRFVFLQLILHLTLGSKVPHPSEFKDIILSSDVQPSILHVSSSSIKTKVINGFPATLGQFSHAVFLVMKANTNKTYGCGGSLIKSNWILTAAHCLRNKVYGYAYAGVVDIINGPFGLAEKFELDQMFPHQNFTSNNPNFEYDIGLIMLTEDIPKNQYTKVIDLPGNCLDYANINGAEITATGFGSTVVKTPGISSLKYITMEVMDRLECQKFFEISIQDSMLCSNTSLGMTTCLGDSGSGLTTMIQNKTVLVGIVSFGNIYCSAGNNFPSVSTRVSSYLMWINETIASQYLILV